VSAAGKGEQAGDECGGLPGHTVGAARAFFRAFFFFAALFAGGRFAFTGGGRGVALPFTAVPARSARTGAFGFVAVGFTGRFVLGEGVRAGGLCSDLLGAVFALVVPKVGDNRASPALACRWRSPAARPLRIRHKHSDVVPLSTVNS